MPTSRGKRVIIANLGAMDLHGVQTTSRAGTDIPQRARAADRIAAVVHRGLIVAVGPMVRPKRAVNAARIAMAPRHASSVIVDRTVLPQLATSVGQAAAARRRGSMVVVVQKVLPKRVTKVAQAVEAIRRGSIAVLIAAAQRQFATNAARGPNAHVTIVRRHTNGRSATTGTTADIECLRHKWAMANTGGQVADGMNIRPLITPMHITRIITRTRCTTTVHPMLGTLRTSAIERRIATTRRMRSAMAHHHVTSIDAGMPAPEVMTALARPIVEHAGARGPREQGDRRPPPPPRRDHEED